MKDKDPRDDLFDALTVSLRDGHKGSRKGGGTQVWLVFVPSVFSVLTQKLKPPSLPSLLEAENSPRHSCRQGNYP